MPVRSCKVTIRDMEGVDHSVQVTAGTLYEAVALGLASIRSEEWVEGIPEGLNTVRVSVRNVPVEHAVKLQDFTAWLKKEGGIPRESSDRLRIRQILGIVANK
jgi:hypothetical protein